MSFFHLWPRPTAHYTQMLWMCCTPHTVKTLKYAKTRCILCSAADWSSNWRMLRLKGKILTRMSCGISPAVHAFWFGSSAVKAGLKRNGVTILRSILPSQVTAAGCWSCFTCSGMIVLLADFPMCLVPTLLWRSPMRAKAFTIRWPQFTVPMITPVLS